MMKNKFSGIKVGVLVIKKIGKKKNESNEKFRPYAPFPDEHAKFVKNMFSILKD